MRDDWFDLFDPVFRESTLRQVEGDIAFPPRPRFPWIARDLLAMLAAYERQISRETDGVEAARKLAQQVSACAELAERGALTTEHATRLGELWLEFVAAGAAYRIYDELPKERSARVSGGKQRGEQRHRLAKKAREEARDALARALIELRNENDFLPYRLADIARKAGVKAGKITRAEVERRAEELLEK